MTPGQLGLLLALHPSMKRETFGTLTEWKMALSPSAWHRFMMLDRRALMERSASLLAAINGCEIGCHHRPLQGGHDHV